MSKRTKGPEARRPENRDRGNGFHSDLTTATLEADYDIETAVPVEVVPLSPRELCAEVQDTLRSAYIDHKITWETDKNGREGVVI